MKKRWCCSGKGAESTLAWLETVLARLESFQQAPQVMRLQQLQVSWLNLVLFHVYAPQ